jgi:cell division protease FtsH
MDTAVKAILDQAYQTAVEVIKDNRDDMDKVVAYLLEKETITGAEMVAIIEGRDPELVGDAYASTRSHEQGFRPSAPEIIEPAARKVHMISQKIESPAETEDGQTPLDTEETPAPEEKPAKAEPDLDDTQIEDEE